MVCGDLAFGSIYDRVWPRARAQESPTAVKKKRKPKKLGEEKLHTVQYKLKAASYTQGGMDWHGLFKQYDKDASG